MGDSQYRHYKGLAHNDRNVSVTEAETYDILRYSTKCKGTSWQQGNITQAPKPQYGIHVLPEKPHLIKPNLLQQSGEYRYRVLYNLKHANFENILQIFRKKESDH